MGSCHGARQKLKLRDSGCTSGSVTRWAGSPPSFCLVFAMNFWFSWIHHHFLSSFCKQLLISWIHHHQFTNLQVTQLLLGLVTRLARVEKEVESVYFLDDSKGQKDKKAKGQKGKKAKRQKAKRQKGKKTKNNHEILWFWSNISRNLQSWDIVVMV